MLRWLHISDLHFNNDDMSTISLREELPQFLKSNNLLCDYVFCTGDIRTANANPNTIFCNKCLLIQKCIQCCMVGIDEQDQIAKLPKSTPSKSTSRSRNNRSMCIPPVFVLPTQILDFHL